VPRAPVQGPLTSIGWSADKPVFGLVMSFSGWFAPIDADTIAGAKLAVAEINSAIHH
jgi:branched-chain amino acid transport system substrate-binding protein